MNLSLVANFFIGTIGCVAAGVSGLYIYSPNVLGIYYDVEIYASVAEENIKSSPEKTVNTRSETPIGKKLFCSVGTNKPIPCSVFSTKKPTTQSTSSKIVDLSEFEKTEISNIADTNSGILSTQSYYKIVVSQELLWHLQKSPKNNNISITIKSDTSSSDQKTLKPFLYSYPGRKITWIHEDSNAEEYYIGTAKSLNISTTSIQQTSNNEGYECSYLNTTQFFDCGIYSLTSGNNDSTAINTTNFVKNDKYAQTISESKIYLIKTKHLSSEFFVQPKSKQPDKKMKIHNLFQAFVFSDTTSTNTPAEYKLFHFNKP